MRKVKPPEGYPPEEGRYVRGNDYSPVAVVVILATFDFATPPEVEALVMSALDAGAALAGTLQTENVGIEKIVCNVVANPNIRYIVICGEESPGHLSGEALKALVENGVDENKRIVGTGAPTPYLYNLPLEAIERFRKQVSVVDLIGCTDPRRRRFAAATKRQRRGSTATCFTTPERIQNRQSSTKLRGRYRNLGWKLRGRKFHRTPSGFC